MMMMASTRTLALAGSIICLIHGVFAERASVRPEDNIPNWQEEASMTMRMGTVGDLQDPNDYIVVPLTETLGLNGSETTRGAVHIQGTLAWIKPDNYKEDRETQQDEVAYISCEDPTDSDVTADDMVNAIMDKTPKVKAILLYSGQTAACALEGRRLSFQSIFTFVDSSDSLKLLDILNKANDQDEITVTISGNATDSPVETITRERGNHSAVAMSVLYSITGLITLLFLLIIGVGAIRAHRYPERYGPRSSDDGSGGQSRAKGIARAVLDTIPIVKFGEPAPRKKDPSLELDDTTVGHVGDLEAGLSRTGSTAERNQDTKTTAESNGNMVSPWPRNGTSGSAGAAGAAGAAGVENLDCSICTDKFVVGEDVRVLPCDHKYHPNCIDPWLTEVSGTCPLCRLDLHDRDSQGQEVPSEGSLPPPLDMDGIVPESSTERRKTRLFDLSRLRHASPEERIQVLRQMRRDQPNESRSTSGDSSDRSRGAKMADKLREKFRIRTRPQSPSNDNRS